jgi:hypothetical protein
MKDWERRFETPSNQWFFLLLAIPLLLWAFFGLLIGFQDSTGTPLNSDLIGHLHVYVVSVGPIFVLVLLACWDRRNFKK